MCSPPAKRRGVRPADVHRLYGQIDHWRKNSCPDYLRRHQDKAGQIATIEPGGLHAGERNDHTQLRRAVLWALEINCFLEVHSCVAAYGLQDGRGMEAEMAATRVEYESVRAMQDMFEICHWMNDNEIVDQDNRRHSLIDLAPFVLRNACAGLCFWSCQRGIEMCRRGPSSLLKSSHRRGHSSGSRDSTEKKGKEPHIQSYVETAQVFRDSVATATSHQDTARVLDGLDKQRALLQAEVDKISPQ